MAPKAQPLQPEAVMESPEGLCFPIRRAHRLLESGRLLFSHLQGLDHRTTRQAKTSTGDFLNASPATILTVRVCEQLNIVGFLYLLVPFLYPVLEKTFYSFLVQKKKLGPLCSSAVFNYVTPPTLCFLGIHLPAEGFIKQPSALSSHCGHTASTHLISTLRSLLVLDQRLCQVEHKPLFFPTSPPFPNICWCMNISPQMIFCRNRYVSSYL